MWIYGATYTTTADEVIGTIPIGYADGWTRIYKVSTLLWMDSFVLLLGVCLWTNHCSPSKVYPLGTPVTLMGENGGANITATRWLKNVVLSTTKFFVCFSDRVPRSYN